MKWFESQPEWVQGVAYVTGVLLLMLVLSGLYWLVTR